MFNILSQLTQRIWSGELKIQSIAIYQNHFRHMFESLPLPISHSYNFSYPKIMKHHSLQIFNDVRKSSFDFLEDKNNLFVYCIGNLIIAL